MICECRAVCARALHGTSTELEIIRISSQSAISWTLQYVDACLCLVFFVSYDIHERIACICAHTFVHTCTKALVKLSGETHFHLAELSVVRTACHKTQAFPLFRFSAFADHEIMESCKRENQ